ncbi:RDD family protein [Flavobacterium alvei]|uniref:RDD family protein n=1 Tax=Flavobacterium alvei TaxID=2080416 RepID=UPI0026EB7DDC|nr:RDD family protein [Flavobacterium alvei]
METKFTIPHYILASKTTRLLNFVIDIFFINILSVFVYLLSSFVYVNANFPKLSNWIDSLDQYEKIIYRIIICFFYYGLTEYLLSKTFAKYFTKTIVVSEDGSKPNFITILARTSLRIMPFECLTFLRGREPGFHDDYSKTFVVKKDKLENSKKEFLEFQNF